MSTNGAASTPGSDFELDCGEVHLKARNVSERVQLRLLATVSLVALGALAISGWALSLNSRHDSQEQEDD
ncbi:hypothetical protein [Streptomyces sp. NPDC057748]|uniref:hypothetical protein n=1 Tax=unclassified Streptomyces TaxID=2593676 RepID=UPI0036857259